MERVQVLIDKLIEQKRNNETPVQMLLTVQMLQNELIKLQQKNATWGTSKVAVVLPVNAARQATENFDDEEVAAKNYETQPKIEEPKKEEPKVEEPKKEEPVKPEPFVQQQPAQEEQKKPEVYEIRRPVIEEVKKEEPQQPHDHFDLVAETPTLMQHQQEKELHELIGEIKESLNDRLKEEKVELAHVLKDGPVKDLRKAIGINDKFVFINDLFRGDEAMYERSIKTINGFHILAEAEYWMNRELKVKLGWNDNKDTVQHFYQLVRRRFA